MKKAESESAPRNAGKKRAAKSASSRSKPAWGENIQSTEELRQAREAILFETAARLFNRYGFHGTSMTQLTEELWLITGQGILM